MVLASAADAAIKQGMLLTNGTNILTDINEQRLAFAKTLGATSVHHIDIQRGNEGVHQVDMATQIANSLGRAPTAALECSGAQSSVHLALKVSTALLFTYIC